MRRKEKGHTFHGTQNKISQPQIPLDKYPSAVLTHIAS